jgi:hypothetical protein
MIAAGGALVDDEHVRSNEARPESFAFVRDELCDGDARAGNHDLLARSDAGE